MKKKIIFLKICCNEWKNSSRDARELSVCKDLNFDIFVVAKSHDNIEKINTYSSYKVLEKKTKPLGLNVNKYLNKIVSFLYWTIAVRKIDADIISGHDISGLTIGWLSNIFKRNKSLLVYDSHEFEIGRNDNRNIIQKLFITVLEKALIKRCAFSMFVNESIANEVKKAYRINSPFIVVRNIPNKFNIKKEICLNKRKNIIKKMKNVEYLAIYVGNITNGRGIEDAILAVSRIDGFGLILLGDYQSKEYYESIKILIDKYKVNDRIYFHSSVKESNIWKYIGAADVSLVNINPISKSYYFSLPNKLFESIQSETPIITSDLPELINIVKKYKIGKICKHNDVDSLVEKLQEMAEIDEIYNKELKHNLIKAKNELCWEKEKKVLKNKYLELESIIIDK